MNKLLFSFAIIFLIHVDQNTSTAERLSERSQYERMPATTKVYAPDSNQSPDYQKKTYYKIEYYQTSAKQNKQLYVDKDYTPSFATYLPSQEVSEANAKDYAESNYILPSRKYASESKPAYSEEVSRRSYTGKEYIPNFEAYEEGKVSEGQRRTYTGGEYLPRFGYAGEKYGPKYGVSGTVQQIYLQTEYVPSFVSKGKVSNYGQGDEKPYIVTEYTPIFKETPNPKYGSKLLQAVANNASHYQPEFKVGPKHKYSYDELYEKLLELNKNPTKTQGSVSVSNLRKEASSRSRAFQKIHQK